MRDSVAHKARFRSSLAWAVDAYARTLARLAASDARYVHAFGHPEQPAHVVAFAGAAFALCGIALNDPRAWRESKTTGKRVCLVCVGEYVKSSP